MQAQNVNSASVPQYHHAGNCIDRHETDARKTASISSLPIRRIW